jgi:hypothetical protein
VRNDVPMGGLPPPIPGGYAAILRAALPPVHGRGEPIDGADVPTQGAKEMRWTNNVRPSTARSARAQDEEIFFVPSRIYLILTLSKDALWMCSALFDRMQFLHPLLAGKAGT